MTRQNTNLVRGKIQRTQFRETSESIILSSGFVYNSAEQAEAIFKGEETGYQYTRYANPTIEMFEKRLAQLDGSETAFATASGMAAVFNSILCQVKKGDHIISSTALFGSCREIIKNILPRFGVEVTFIDGRNIEDWKKNIKPNTKIFFFETPSNPCLDIIDIKKICALAKENKIITIVDNILLSPVLQKPITFGADIVVYSGTKHIDGQGRTIGGAICTTEQFREETLKPFLRHTGPCLSPLNAWTLLKGLETISLRVNEQSKSTLEIAKFLKSHKKIEKLNYTHLEHPQIDLAKQQQKTGGTVLSFLISGGKEQAFKFINNLKIFDISNNFGDAKSLAIHPATTTHRVLEQEERTAQGIKDNLVRLSIGLEDVTDLVEDIDQALN
jgi:O-succinylhomoserine sulfhydrylase